MNILAISGSVRKGSYNTALLRALQSIAPAGVSLEIATVGDLPLYDQDAEADFPKEAQALKTRVEGANALIIATPEYNRSIPGVLKNAIDWLSRPYGHNSFRGKRVLVAGVSVGKIGTAVAQSHLKQMLVYLDAHVVGQPELYLGPAGELFDEAGNLSSEPTKELLAKALETLVRG